MIPRWIKDLRAIWIPIAASLIPSPPEETGVNEYKNIASEAQHIATMLTRSEIIGGVKTDFIGSAESAEWSEAISKSSEEFRSRETVRRLAGNVYDILT